ncbi:RHS repeat domain-containing protein [Tunicatimonas pelagia]|uniref:RHS repeat domain-containing protein n=1 Tax=Tunicatimonas pelagia TaxID=931531 RepID=UPI002666EC35|nr:RHS repeat-associated core domain-containing protein [Tunicatimonas pelagia]WKN43943.1 RHS repeat-associated core domain-containing protein [Tunicatimonas pelagia]
MYIYLSNESTQATPVYFDDFKVEHTHAPVIADESYYPYGLTHRQLLNDPTNKYLYNGKELQDELGLGWYDYGARMYQPDLGRWYVIDPLSFLQEEYSPYHYTYDNPIAYNDPSGMMGQSPTKFASTFIDETGKVVEHRDDGDNNVYLIGSDWVSTGSEEDKAGLSIVGHEDPNKNYRPGDQYQLYVDHGINPDYTLESFLIPLARPIGWLGKYAIRLVNRGGKWVYEVFEQTTNRVVRRFSAKNINIPRGGITFSESATKAAENLGFYPSDIAIKNGVAEIPITWSSNFKPSDIRLVLESLRSLGATKVIVNSGPIINTEKLLPFLNKLYEMGRTYQGFKIVKTGNPNNMFILEKTL